MRSIAKYQNLRIYILILVLTDQLVKILIVNSQLINYKSNFLLGIIRFNAKQNHDFSWVNDILNLNIGKVPHIIFISLLFLLSVQVYSFILLKRNISRTLIKSFMLIISGTLCSLIDIIFWGGSLDIFELKNMFIFDLKDFYISTFITIASFYILKYWKHVLIFKTSTFLKYIKIKTRRYLHVLVSH